MNGKAQQRPVYLFLGQDNIRPDGLSQKDIALNQIKKQFLNPQVEKFNLDILYSREISLKGLQERLLAIPVKSKVRVVLIRDAGSLKEEIKEYILKYLKKPFNNLLLILDAAHYEPKDTFIKGLLNYAQVLRFKETLKVNTFNLSRAIEAGRPDFSLNVLKQLLDEGVRPEWILSGLRYAWERNLSHPLQARKRLSKLLRCDIEIKTGRLRPQFALEKLVVGLCRLE